VINAFLRTKALERSPMPHQAELAMAVSEHRVQQPRASLEVIALAFLSKKMGTCNLSRNIASNIILS
jgi:hypothetical protein